MSYSEGWLVKREEYSQFANAELARNSRLSCLYQDWNQNKRMKLCKCCVTLLYTEFLFSDSAKSEY